jgi:hypothetical protein
VGTVTLAVFIFSQMAPEWLGATSPMAYLFLQGETLTAERHVLFRMFVNQFSGVLYAMVFLFLLVLLRVILRRDWLAMAAWCVFVASPMHSENPLVEWPFGLLRAVVMLLVLLRGGLLALAVTLVVTFTMIELPLTLDFSSWYAMRGLPVVLVMAGLAVYGFHTALAGKPMFGRALDD